MLKRTLLEERSKFSGNDSRQLDVTETELLMVENSKLKEQLEQVQAEKVYSPFFHPL